MTTPIKITLENRDVTGKEESGRMRRSGFIPAVVYGPSIKETLHVKVNAKTMMPYLTSMDAKNFVFEATLPNGDVKNCVIKSASKEFATDEILHIDFYVPSCDCGCN